MKNLFPLILFVLVFVPCRAQVKMVRFMHEKEYRIYADALLYDINHDFYNAVTTGKIKAYKDVELNEELSAVDLVHRTSECETVSIQLDPNDPYKTSDSTVCSLMKVSRIFIHKREPDVAISLKGYAIGFATGTGSNERIMYYCNLASASVYVPDVQYDFFYDYYDLGEIGGKVSAGNITLDSASMGAYALKKFKDGGELLYKAVDVEDIKAFDYYDLKYPFSHKAFLNVFDIQNIAGLKHLMADSGTGLVYIQQYKTAKYETTITKYAIGISGKSKYGSAPDENTFFYVAYKDAEKAMNNKLPAYNYLSPIRFFNFVANYNLLHRAADKLGK